MTGVKTEKLGESENFLYILYFHLLNLNHVNVLPVQIINKNNLYSSGNLTVGEHG